jgi:hypothetical protein
MISYFVSWSIKVIFASNKTFASKVSILEMYWTPKKEGMNTEVLGFGEYLIVILDSRLKGYTVTEWYSDKSNSSSFVK